MTDRYHRVGLLIDGLAWWAVGLPLLVGLSFLMRLIGVGLGPGIAAAALTTFGLLWWEHRRFAIDAADGPLRLERPDVVLMALVTCAVLIPTIRLAMALGGGPSPETFLSSDDCYTLMIARGVWHEVPPPDLSYARETIHYHFGPALLTVSLSWLTRLSLHATYYGAVPIILKVLLLASIFRLVGSCQPAFTTRDRVLALVVSAGVFWIDPYNCVFNLRNAFVGGSGKIVTALYGMPVVQPVAGLLTARVFDSAILASAWVVILLANLDRVGWIATGILLFAVFLTKAQVFLGFGLAWAAYALVLLVLHRNWRPLASGVLALSLAVPVLPLSSTYGNLVGVRLARGVNVDWLATRAWPAHQLMAGDNLLVAAAIGLLCAAGGLHVFGLAIASWQVRSRPPFTYGLALAGILAPLALCAVLALAPTPELTERFHRVHAGYERDLWLPAATYLPRILAVSLSTANDLALSLLVIVSAVAVVQLSRRAAGTRRWLARTAATTAAIFMAGQLIQQTLTPGTSKQKRVDPLAAEALAHIPVRYSVILTNELRYDRTVERHLPLLNVWGPALFGHQYWASNFMFNFQRSDAPGRRRRTDWFWRRPWDGARRRFLAAEGINVLLVRRDDSRWLHDDPMAGLERVFTNDRYVVYRLIP